MSSEMEAKTRKTDAETWETVEAELREIPIFEDFRYSQCPDLNSGRN